VRSLAPASPPEGRLPRAPATGYPSRFLRVDTDSRTRRASGLRLVGFRCFVDQRRYPRNEVRRAGELRRSHRWTQRRVASSVGSRSSRFMMAASSSHRGLGAIGLIDNANKWGEPRPARAAVSLDRSWSRASGTSPTRKPHADGLAADLQSQPGLSSEPGSSMYTIKDGAALPSVDVATCGDRRPARRDRPAVGGAFCGATTTGGTEAVAARAPVRGDHGSAAATSTSTAKDRRRFLPGVSTA